MRSFLLNSFDRFRNGWYAARIRHRDLRRYISERNGFFIEAGANDGITQSNTYGFEIWRGWHGLLVEPLIERAAECAVRRRRSVVEQCALVPFGYDEVNIELVSADLMTFVAGSADDGERAENAARTQHISTSKISVKAQTLQSLLLRHRVSKIDFLSLDVEGYELQVLHGLNMQTHAPTFILVEHGSRPEIESFLGCRYTKLVVFSNDDALYKLKG